MPTQLILPANFARGQQRHAGKLNILISQDNLVVIQFVMDQGETINAALEPQEAATFARNLADATQHVINKNLPSMKGKFDL